MVWEGRGRKALGGKSTEGRGEERGEEREKVEGWGWGREGGREE